ncbi:HAMP domain-containing histidine kinase [Kibdelosporangium philippinense]|uniref:histidine kinase n=1 Tax=Kibdelosporangium philippinense TaxID=211113 RepID=A0ABS8YZU4_9PSEU|nr:HAMP domain-containing sensor histidine kinase [Kibdelosporangium philippinense]MCE7001253.1 HAMP domain-containing histidine kinase [Kibdelosporangium philippinense]
MSGPGWRAWLIAKYVGVFLSVSMVVVVVLHLHTRSSILSVGTSEYGELVYPVEPQLPAIDVDSSSQGGSTVAEPRVDEPVSDWSKDALAALVDDRNEALDRLLTQSVVTFLTLGLMSALLAWWLSARVLRRVHRITARARKVSATNLHERIELGGPQDELRELSDTFDELLGRLEAAFDAQSRFIANASHELRTPLTVVRSLVQVGLATDDPERIREAKAELLHYNDRCTALVNGLLTLARGEQGGQRHEPLRLDVLVEKTMAKTTAPGLTIRVDTQPCVVDGDIVLLEQVVCNLADNAVRYNEPGGHITVEVGQLDCTAVLRVANSGIKVPQEETARLFEPFRRGSAARLGHSTGTGLGLSIVRAIIAAHGGAVRADPRTGGGLEVTAAIPLSEVDVSRSPGAGLPVRPSRPKSRPG